MGLRGPKGAQQPTEEHAGRGYKCPNGALYSTVHDMAVFLDAITPVRPPDPPCRKTLVPLSEPAASESLSGLIEALAPARFFQTS